MKKIFAIIALALPLVLTSCLKDKIYEGPSTITALTLNPVAPTSNDAVTVSVETAGLQDLKSANLTYNGTSVDMTVTGKKASGVIPALADKTVVKVVVNVVNAAGYTTTKEAEYTVGNPPTDWTKLVINELYGAGADNEKFIELYNNSDFAIGLKDVYIHKDEGLCWTGLEGEEVPAHGFFLILGAKGTTERGISSGFSAKKSVLIQVFNPSGQLVDKFERGDGSLGWGNQGLPNNTGAWARIPDGKGDVVIVTNPTPGTANDNTGATPDPDYVK